MRKKLLVFITLFVANNGFGQVVDFKTDRYWLEAGLATYNSTQNSGGISLNINASFNRDEMLYKLRFFNHQELSIFGPRPSENLYEVGGLIGKLYTDKFFQFHASAGLGAIMGKTRGEQQLSSTAKQSWISLKSYETEKIFTPSIPLNIDVNFKPIKYFMIGFGLYANLNSKRPLYGFALTGGLGKVR